MSFNFMAAVTIHSNFGVQESKIFYKVSQETGKVAWHSHLFKNFPVCDDPYSQRLSSN